MNYCMRLGNQRHKRRYKYLCCELCVPFPDVLGIGLLHYCSVYLISIKIF